VLRADLVRRIYAIKNRSYKKPISWIVADFKMAERFVEFSAKARELADNFWPGQLTLVLPLKKTYARIFGVSADASVGIRVSSCVIACEISRVLNSPIVATSANVSGASGCYSAQEAYAQFTLSPVKPDFAIDSGVLPNTPPTTIARVIDDKVEILRQGEIEIL
jgi:L-threonylcarbamoyladenylate synthase